jgi:transposase
VILIPIFYEVGEDPEDIAASGIFKNVFEVVRAMADHDSRLQAEINNIKLGEGKRGDPQARVNVDFAEERLVLTGFEKLLKASLVECVVERIADSWEVRFEELKRFKAEHGHCNVVAQSGPLGRWVHNQRALYQGTKGDYVLSRERVDRLTNMGFEWGGTEGGYLATEFGAFFGADGNTVSRWASRGIVHPEKKPAGYLFDDENIEEAKRNLGLTHMPGEWEADFETLAQLVARTGVGKPLAYKRMYEGALPVAGKTYLTGSGVVFLFKKGAEIPRYTQHGERNRSASLTREQVLAIFDDPRSNREIADAFGASLTTVQKIRLRRTWTHITKDLPDPPGHKKKMSREQALEIYHATGKQREIAKRYGVGVSTVGSIKTGATWSTVTGHKAGAAE